MYKFYFFLTALLLVVFKYQKEIRFSSEKGEEIGDWWYYGNHSFFGINNWFVILYDDNTVGLTALKHKRR